MGGGVQRREPQFKDATLGVFRGSRSSGLARESRLGRCPRIAVVYVLRAGDSSHSRRIREIRIVNFFRRQAIRINHLNAMISELDDVVISQYRCLHIS